jgi:hypothetical protein
MLGLLEDEKERGEISQMSLEYAYISARNGKLRFIMWAWAAAVCPCECGGPQDSGFNCVQDNHSKMRRELREGKVNVTAIQA